MDRLTGPEIDLLSVQRGSVTAPAGCGKTQLVANALARHAGPKPVLVLTHTNAGVMALKGRLDRAGVPVSAYRLSTLDGWAMRLAATFPARSGIDPRWLELRNPGGDYQQIRRAAAVMLQGQHLDDLLSSSYDRLLVDEYQDCSQIQHALVGIASRVLPTCVLGDPLQAIFGFKGNALAHWEEDVRRLFPHVAELSIPWRWINAGERAFGEWLLVVRGHLAAGQPVDLRAAPSNVQWIPMDGAADRARRLAACRTRAPTEGGGVLIMAAGRDKAGQRRFASETPGAVTVESVDLADLVGFADRFDPGRPNALHTLCAFADEVMSGADGAGLAARLAARRPDGAGSSSDVETAALAFLAARSHRAAVEVLVALGRQGGVRAHRQTVLACCIKALNACDGDVPGAFAEAAVRAREENRLLGRILPARAVASTLLLKGLEAEVAVVLDVEDMDAAHLYVAMTRGSKQLVVCSRSPVLNG